MNERHIIVIGSGIAGLIAALRLSRRHAVTLVTKCELSESNTRWAQGGIAAALFPDDSVALHIEDTLKAGAGLCNPEAVEILCSEGPERVRDLIGLGVAFDSTNGQLARGLEAAHSRARVLHAQGDATGLSIETALVRAVGKTSVHVLEHTFALDLVLSGDRVTGIESLNSDGERSTIHADAVVLASGGAGHLFRHTTNPASATGDGAAMALRAGAQLADLEFYQFHPTALAVPETFLISEAVRGEGAVLLDVHGRRFMQALDPLAELAPRDVVARGIALQMEAQDGRPVLLDATKLGAEFLRKRFPTIDAACRLRGLDWTREPIPVTPAAHYWMGGVRTDLWGRTSLAGLFAVGEVACTGVHGANRLASNSLLESLVFAWRCADLLLETDDPNAPADLRAVEKPQDSLHFGDFITSSSQAQPASRREIQNLMWKFAGIEREGTGLQLAKDQLAAMHVEGATIPSLETLNLLQLARALTTAALARRESRGAHFRRDFPDTSPVWRRSLLYEQTVQVEHRMQVPCS